MEDSVPESNDEANTPLQSATSSYLRDLVFDSNETLGGVYVPPHLRNAQRQNDSDSEAILKLTRQLKGLLNR